MQRGKWGRMKTYGTHLLVALGLWISGLICPGPGHPADTPQSVADLEVFVRDGCPRCAAAERFLADLQREWPALQIVVHDIGKDPGALARLQDLAVVLGIQTLGVPAFYVRGELLIGYLGAATTGARLKALLTNQKLRSFSHSLQRWQCDLSALEDEMLPQSGSTQLFSPAPGLVMSTAHL